MTATCFATGAIIPSPQKPLPACFRGGGLCLFAVVHLSGQLSDLLLAAARANPEIISDAFSRCGRPPQLRGILEDDFTGMLRNAYQRFREDTSFMRLNADSPGKNIRIEGLLKCAEL